MAFGQQSGPPATAKQVQELLELLHVAGHTDFRDARGPMGFTQRQAGGRFTRDETTAFIDRLQEQGHAEAPTSRPGADRAPAAVQPPLAGPAGDRALRRMPAEHLAAELERRGWIVIPP